MKKFVFCLGVLESVGEITRVLELDPSTGKTELSLALTVDSQTPLTTVKFQLPGQTVGLSEIYSNYFFKMSGL